MYRHSFDALSFVFGLLFIGMAFFAPVRDWFPGETARWIAPGVVLLLGAGLAVFAVASNESQNQSDEHPPG